MWVISGFTRQQADTSHPLLLLKAPAGLGGAGLGARTDSEAAVAIWALNGPFPARGRRGRLTVLGEGGSPTFDPCLDSLPRLGSFSPRLLQTCGESVFGYLEDSPLATAPRKDRPGARSSGSWEEQSNRQNMVLLWNDEAPRSEEIVRVGGPRGDSRAAREVEGQGLLVVRAVGRGFAERVSAELRCKGCTGLR
ncbi:uncharacterized protein H3C15 [Equus caballus]|uniref:uncharacterized protein H3C15 n=1 Tax=Equus caballus TaxID=9796 RepID=UPI0038B298E3